MASYAPYGASSLIACLPTAYAVGYILAPLRGDASAFGWAQRTFDQPLLTCYKDWFCAEPPARRLIENWWLLRYKHPTRPSSTLLFNAV